MLRMKLRNGLRIGILAFVVALALTAAYYYGATRAQSVVALPTAISLTAPGGAATTLPDATTLPTATTVQTATGSTSTPTTPSTTDVATTGRSTLQTGTGQSGTTATTSRAPRPAQSASSPPTRQVVTPIRGWDCEPHGATDAPTGSGSTGTTDCR